MARGLITIRAYFSGFAMFPPGFATSPPCFATSPPCFATSPPGFATSPPGFATRLRASPRRLRASPRRLRGAFADSGDDPLVSKELAASVGRMKTSNCNSGQQSYIFRIPIGCIITAYFKCVSKVVALSG